MISQRGIYYHKFKKYLLPDSGVFGESVKHQRPLAQPPSTFGRTETVESVMEQFS